MNVFSIYIGVTVFYSIIWISSVYSKNGFIVFIFLLSVFFIYGLSREYIVFPMIDFIQDYLHRVPWIVDKNISN